jgi:hypothetical protein
MFRENLFGPSRSPVKIQNEILDIFFFGARILFLLIGDSDGLEALQLCVIIEFWQKISIISLHQKQRLSNGWVLTAGQQIT